MYQPPVEGLLVIVSLWNLMPCEIRFSPSLNSFKINLKTSVVN